MVLVQTIEAAPTILPFPDSRSYSCPTLNSFVLRIGRYHHKKLARSIKNMGK
jgi:hypothetical protein